jgi:hypothetical protein
MRILHKRIGIEPDGNYRFVTTDKSPLSTVTLRREEGYRDDGTKRAVRVSRISHLPSRLTMT